MDYLLNGFALVNVLIVLLIVVIGVYISMLLIQFLKAGIEAFRLYIKNNRRY